MPYLVYSYKFKRKLPLLDEDEWPMLSVLLYDRIASIKLYREMTGASLKTAKDKDPGGREALNAYLEISGLRLENADFLYSLRPSDYGSLCPECEKPFRTPKAKFCAECGFDLPEGEVAGPMDPSQISHLAVNQRYYSVFHNQILLGHSRLEYGDPPMGVAHGRFIQAPEFRCFRANNSAIEDRDQRRWEGFQVFDDQGVELVCNVPISIIEYGVKHDPFDIEVNCIALKSPEFEELFPHHQAAYENSF